MIRSSIHLETHPNSTALASITLPYSLEYFDGSYHVNSPNIVFHVPENSYAHQWAVNRNIDYTTYKLHGYQYKLLDDGTIAITGCYDTETDLVIPSTIDGYQVTEIGESAFYYRTNIKSVVIPEGVKYIRQAAFRMCYNLKKVTLPSTLLEIEASAFGGHRLSSLTLPENLSSIGRGAFSGSNTSTNGISTLTIPGNVRYIGQGAFQNTPIKKVVLSEGIEVIGYHAFTDCGIGTLTIPASVGQITGHPCLDANIKVASGNPDFAVKDGALYHYSYRGDTLVACIKPGKTTSFTVPANVKYIGTGAFEYGNLTSVTLPEGLRSIGTNAFCGCFELTNIEIPSSVSDIRQEAFLGCLKLESLRIPEMITECHLQAFVNCPKLKLTVTYGSKVHYDILNGNFDGVSSYTTVPPSKTVKLPASTEVIGERSFYGSDLIHYVIIPEGTKTIGNFAFTSFNLRTVHIPASVENIARYAFGSADNLIIIAPSGSYAINYAQANGIPYIIE